MECAIAHHECNSLCNVCNAAIFGEAKCRISTKKGTGHLPHHPSLHGLFDAAQDGCYICSIVWQNINHDSSIPYQPNQATKSKESSIANGTSLLSLKEEHEVVPGGGALFKLDIIVSAPMASWSPKDTRFRIIPTTDSVVREHFPQIEVDDTTSSRSTLNRAQNWLSDCLCTHSRCSFNNPSSWRPTRMLYIGTASDTVWKVVTSQDIDTSQQDTIYITLSYRWGVKPQQLLLLSSNLQSLREGQPICDLPQTFKELIIVARQFGVWYVWIDALCIIQDSKEDWELEAPTMRQVYANAVCNIAATASDSPEGGLFRARIPRNLKPGLIHPSGLNGDEKSYYIWEKSVLERRIKHSPLHNRGWVFQERLLAPRVLYFANDQILWECMQTARCESFPNGIPYNSSLKSMDYILELTERAQDSLFKSVEAENPTERQPPEESGLFCSVHPEAAELWRSLVKQYTQCSLTVSHDRLPAFSGIARLFHEATGDDYYAGLWGGSLLLQLDWRVVNPAKRKVSSYRAPSWSWASVDGAVQLYGDMLGTRFLVSVIDINVRPTTHDSFGSVSSGYMTITGLLARATIQHYDDQFDTYQILTKDDAMEVQISPDTLDLDLSLGESIWYIPFKWYPVEFDTEREGMTVACLVVEPVLCTVAPLYRRLGIMSTSEYALDMGDVDWAMKPTIPDHYDERKSHSMDHYITIV